MKQLEKILCAFVAARLAGESAAVPDGAGPLFEAFAALSSARSYGPNGPNPITWADLAAWSRMMRVPIEPHHARIIMAMDRAWLDQVYSKAGQAPEGVKTLPPMSAKPLTAALFDVVAG